MENAKTTWTIDVGYLDLAREAFQKLVKRAEKLGVAAPTLTVGETRMAGTGHRRRAVVDVSTDVPVVKLDGWRFVAKLDATETPKPIIKTAPGQELTTEERTRATEAGHECDHCRVNRARNLTYVVAHEDGRRAQVGSTCVDDFLGHSAGAEIARLDAFGGFAGDMEDIGGRGPATWDLSEVLVITVAMIAAEGWTPRSKARFDGCSTADLVLQTIDPTPAGAEDARKFVEAITAKQAQMAHAVREWLRTVTPDSDYLHNLVAVSEAGFVTMKTMGIAVSAVAAYDRAMERETKRKQAAEANAASEHVGEVKKRQGFGEVTVERVRYIEGNYGCTTIIKFLDANQNILVWFASNPPDVEVGDRFNMVLATVKKHDEYKGTKQTIVTRAKLEAVSEEAA